MLSIERQFVRTERPLYSHLVSLLESAIAKGDLPSGARVPPERALAQQLKISRTTVVSVSRARVARPVARLRRARHVRLRGAGAGRHAARVAREDCGRCA
jgi:DNA-binding FadR family transcriptional regulator